jgi:hypothetical protein
VKSSGIFFACAEAGGKIYVISGRNMLKNALKTVEASDAVASSLLPLSDPQRAGKCSPCDLASQTHGSPLYLAPVAVLVFFQIPVPEMQHLPSPLPLHRWMMPSLSSDESICSVETTLLLSSR